MVLKGIVLGSTAAGGLTASVAGLIWNSSVVVDEISHNTEPSRKYKTQKETSKKLISIYKTSSKDKQLSHPKLQQYHFGHWKYKSEGGSQPLYLIDTNQVFTVIPPKDHSQANKSLWNGRKINHSSGWFGTRSFEYNKLDQSEKEDSKRLWKRYKTILSKLNHEELQKLSTYLNDFEDNKWCEIIDIFWDCGKFTKTIIPTNYKIKEGMKMQLENILLLSKHDQLDNIWSDLSQVIDKTVAFKKIENLQKHISLSGVQWLKKYFQNIPNEKINPLTLYFAMLNNQSFGFECHKGDAWEEEYFKECKETQAPGGAIKVTHVIKSTVDWVENGNQYLPKKDGKYNINEKNWQKWWIAQLAMKKEDQQELKRKLKETGLYKGILDENCNQFNTTILGIIETKGVETQFCKEIMEQIFGPIVTNKRFCLYEIPAATGYLRATKLFIFTLTTWHKGNKFWAKCNNNGH